MFRFDLVLEDIYAIFLGVSSLPWVTLEPLFGKKYSTIGIMERFAAKWKQTMAMRSNSKQRGRGTRKDKVEKNRSWQAQVQEFGFMILGQLFDIFIVQANYLWNINRKIKFECELLSTFVLFKHSRSWDIFYGLGMTQLRVTNLLSFRLFKCFFDSVLLIEHGELPHVLLLALHLEFKWGLKACLKYQRW